MKAVLPRAAMPLVLASYASAALLHVDRAPFWCSAAAAIAIAWRLAHQQGRIALPNSFTRISLALLLTASILLAIALVPYGMQLIRGDHADIAATVAIAA